MLLKSSFIPFSHLIFGVPANFVDVGFQLYSFWPSCHLYMAKLAYSVGLSLVNYILLSNKII